ncbi:NifU family protein [Escherichia coli]
MHRRINPQLAGHGGQRFTDGNHRRRLRHSAIGGGCNGCSMVDVTLKEGIEKQLLNEFPELKGVRDLTEHQRGEHSYY